jgi:hypothetical protein
MFEDPMISNFLQEEIAGAPRRSTQILQCLNGRYQTMP